MATNTRMHGHTATAPSDDEIRAQQRELWNTFSPGWEKWDEVISAAMAGVGQAIIRSLHVQREQRHLDVAAGTGEPGLTIAALAPAGTVTITDQATGMLDVARRRASSQSIENVVLEACSADDLPFADAAFDSVSCRFGFMFFPDMAKAAAEAVRVLRPGGRFSAAVWAGPEQNPWATIPGDAIATEVDLPAPGPGAPSMFRCAAPGLMTSLLERAGLTEVVEWDEPILLTLPRPEDYWRLLVDVTAPVAVALERVGDAPRERIASKVIETARSFVENGLVRLPGSARCVVGVRP